MALVPKSSLQGLDPPEKAIQDAVRDFQSILTNDQCAQLQSVKAVPDADAVIIFTAQLDHCNRSRKGRSIASRLHDVLQSVREFTAVVDSFVSARPDIAALVWGSIKLTMLGRVKIAVNATSYFEPLSNLFMGFKVHCPLFAEYQALYPNSPRLQKALCNFHAAIVRCCKHAVEVIHRPCLSIPFSRKRALADPYQGQKQLVNVLWHSFRIEFKPDIDAVEASGKEVKAEVALAKAQADRQDQELQRKERESASESRSTLGRFMFRARDDLDTIRQQQLQRDQRRARKERQLLLEKLSSHDYLGPFREARKKRLCNTGEWILLTPQFKRWVSTTSSSLLHCSGKKVGSGKTILTASAIDHVFANRRTKDESVTFFFIRFDDPQSTKAEIVFRSLLRQSLDPLTLSGKMEAGLRELDRMLCPSLEDLVALLQQRIALSKSFYLFIDALDECDALERRRLLDALSLISNMISGLKIFLAGRESLSVELRREFPIAEQISMESVEARLDMSLYVEAALLQRMQTRELFIGDSLHQELKRTLTQHADGMFIWVTYLIDELCSYNCDADIRKALGNLPKNLEETFNRALSRIVSRRHDKIAQRILPWVAVAKRNLTLEELRQAISTEVVQPHSRLDTLVQGIENVVAWCENLLHVDEEDKTVQFAHRTVYDFLCMKSPMPELADFRVNLQEADHRAGEICVTYLHFNDFKTTLAQRPRPIRLPAPEAIAHTALKRRGASGLLFMTLSSKLSSSDESFHATETFATFGRADPDEPAARLQTGHPFLKYAAQYWIEHTADFLNGRSATWNLWQNMVLNGHALAQVPWPGHDSVSSQLQMFRWGCQTRHYALVDFIKGRGVISDSETSSAMIQPGVEGDARLINILLQGVMSPYYLKKPLRESSRHGRIEIIERLLAKGADINAELDVTGGGTALQAASEGGQLKAIEWLLAKGADVNAKPSISEGRTALQAASEGGHLEVIERLLAEGADVNAEPAFGEGRTALQAAAGAGHLEVVERLLAEGAEVNAGPSRESGRTALQAAAAGGHLEVVERLLAEGAYVNAKPADDSGRTALEAAAGGGHVEVVEKLLSEKADVNADPALQAASRGGHFEVVELLLAANVNAGGRSVLQEATEGGYLHVNKGADIDIAKPAEHGNSTDLRAGREKGRQFQMLSRHCSRVGEFRR
ncbi:hypothetical protein L249_6927 [Ophiocordyceps polyrhachis-furcata BCC 54312]|uniref:Uncharacterized protein n=1 Tax=Ophiocordyceps polyrhachis-furcata BCC 54312 TaxID=1330021 RepID=A0A367LLC9_9HYPO|nr:hypothetical protein L249_6927 [Ophiocordyceps polyrhachis-furcata BCC 54312]